MKITANWLKSYIQTALSPDEIADKLTHTGLEVEEVTPTGFGFTGIVAGKVVSCKKHPNADRLTVCEVFIGEETLPIVCGAPNVMEGQTVAVATVGTQLPVKLPDGSPLIIKKSKIRGEVSQGMICAEDELGLGDNHDGIIVLPDNLEAGAELSEYFGSTADHTIEIGLTPNRPDASCHVGCARDLHAVTGEPFSLPETTFSPAVEHLDDDLKVTIKDADKCHRYVGVLVEGVTVKESPNWLKQRLLGIGLRPINNIVDATNYVLHELGQPLHAFDYHQLKNRHIVVQSFSKETIFTTLDDAERKIPAGTLFICDGDQPVALAGIMGGQNSEISDQTKDVLIESAWFEPVGIRKSSKTLALQTDSSYRFERGVDPLITRKAAIRCAELICELAGGTIRNGIVDCIAQEYKPRIATLRISRMWEILGTQIPGDTAKSILERLGFEVREENRVLECVIPSWRPDVNTEIDLIEEVARIYDYNNIPNPDYLKIREIRPVPLRERFRERIRESVKGMGYSEIYTNSLLPEKFAEAWDAGSLIATLNPITKDQSLLRPTLEYGFLRSAAHNLKRKISGVRFFEIGDVFEKSSNGRFVDGVDERSQLLMGVAGEKTMEHWSTGKSKPYSFFDLKADVSAFLTVLGYENHVWEQTKNDYLILLISSETIGRLAPSNKALALQNDVHVPAFIAELDLEKLIGMESKKSRTVYKPVPRFPVFDFDLAVVVGKEVAVGELEKTIQKAAGKLLQSIQVFDVFEGGSLSSGKKSVAFRFQFLSEDKTLTISDIDPIIQKVLKQMNAAFSAELRK